MRWVTAVLLVIVLAAAGGGAPGRLDALMRDAVAQARHYRAELARAGAPALARWLDDTRDAAIREGVRPLPPGLRARLASQIEPELLDRVRWRVGFPEATRVAPAFRMAGALAVTLGEVVIFTSPDSAASELLWVHELEHVRQYARWGTTGFAERYLLDWESVEDQAKGAAVAYRLRREALSGSGLR